MFNAAQGARHPQASAVAYLKTDNSFSMTGKLSPDAPDEAQNPQTRYKYSPVHQDVAVCCVPNAGRIYPYYVKTMWLRSPGGLTAALFGPCVLETEINGVCVKITEETNYPFDLEMTFSIEAAQPAEFNLSFRKPAWAKGFTLEGAVDYREENGLISLRRIWQNGDCIRLSFEAEVKFNSFLDSETLISRGPLLFALPLEGEEQTGRQYPLAGFCDLRYLPTGDPGVDLQLAGKPTFSLEREAFSPEHPWQVLSLTGSLFDCANQCMKPVRLIPLGGSVLRKATFSTTALP